MKKGENKIKKTTRSVIRGGIAGAIGGGLGGWIGSSMGFHPALTGLSAGILILVIWEVVRLKRKHSCT